MPLVRPLGPLGPLGLLLPTFPQGKFLDHIGTTRGSTSRSATILGAPGPGAAGAMAELCRDAEATGAGGLWAIDHLFWPRPLLECLTTLTVAATATTRVTLGSCVLQLPLRSPAVVAKQAASLQLLSGGRFVLGIGVGSHPGEFAMAGADFARRGPAIDQGIAALRAAWASAGEPDLVYRQSPAVGEMPIWIGGSSAVARRRAARVGDGWVPLFLSPERYAHNLLKLREETAAAGRDPAAVTAAEVVVVHVGPEDRARAQGCAWLSSFYGIPPKAFARHLIAGSAARCAEQLVAHLESGADHVIVMIADDHAVEHFAELAEVSGLRVGSEPVQPSSTRPDLSSQPELEGVGV